MAYNQPPSYGQLSTTQAATASTIQAARYGAYTPSYQRPYVPGSQHTPYLPQQGNYTQMFPMLHPQPQLLLNQAPAKQEDDALPDEESSSTSLKYLISSLLEAAGFTGSEKQALDLLQKEIIAVVRELYQDARLYSHASHRQSPTVLDLAQVCLNNGLTPRELRKTVSRARSITLTARSDRETSPDLLGSDDENVIPHIPPTLRYMPPHFPPLPPRHTYLRTPVAAAVKKALPSLEKKLANAALVQESLKSLIIATEDTKGPEDAELIGHVVNWENAASARKRWRLH